jgi:hypothetical protein
MNPGLFALAACAALAACRGPDTNTQAPAQPPKDNGMMPSLPLPPQPLSRVKLLEAVAVARSAAAAGRDDSAAQRKLENSRFELRIRFGCAGPAAVPTERLLGWTYDPASRTLRVRAQPTITKRDALALSVGADAFEAVEGFWIPRPWLLDPVCPAPASKEGAAEPSAKGEPQPDATPSTSDRASPSEKEQVPTVVDTARVGIAQFFSATESRTRRRAQRPYEVVQRLESDPVDGEPQFDLVLAGRLTMLPSGKVISCVVESRDRAPDCLIAARFDQVRIERAGGSEVLGEWHSG